MYTYSISNTFDWNIPNNSIQVSHQTLFQYSIKSIHTPIWWKESTFSIITIPVYLILVLIQSSTLALIEIILIDSIQILFRVLLFPSSLQVKFWVFLFQKPIQDPIWSNKLLNLIATVLSIHSNWVKWNPSSQIFSNQIKSISIQRISLWYWKIIISWLTHYLPMITFELMILPIPPLWVVQMKTTMVPICDKNNRRLPFVMEE